jgi:hypothetical protein
MVAGSLGWTLVEGRTRLRTSSSLPVNRVREDPISRLQGRRKRPKDTGRLHEVVFILSILSPLFAFGRIKPTRGTFDGWCGIQGSW